MAGPWMVEEMVTAMLPLLRATVQNVAGPRMVERMVEEMVAAMLPLLRATVHNVAGPRVVEEVVAGVLFVLAATVQNVAVGMLPLPSHIL